MGPFGFSQLAGLHVFSLFFLPPASSSLFSTATERLGQRPWSADAGTRLHEQHGSNTSAGHPLRGSLPRPLGTTSPEPVPGAQGVPYDPLEGVPFQGLLGLPALSLPHLRRVSLKIRSKAVPVQGLFGLQALSPSQVCRVSLMIRSKGFLPPRPLGTTGPELGPMCAGCPL